MNNVLSVEGASHLDDQEFVQRVRSWYEEADQARNVWFADEKREHDFYHGRQWSEGDAQAIKASGRVPITINRIAPMINIVAGYERRERSMVKFLPVDVHTDPIKAELLSEVARVVQEMCDADHIRSQAFMDCIIGGRGFIEVYVDAEDNPNGDIRVAYVPPEEIWLDPACRRYDLSDARYIIRVQRMPLETVLSMFPDRAEEVLEKARLTVSVKEAGLSWDMNIWQQAYDPQDKSWEVLEVWYRNIEEKQSYFVGDVELSEEELMVRLAENPDLSYITRQIRRNRIYHAFLIGATVLHNGPSEYDWNGYPYVPYFGIRDRYQNRYYGLVKNMIDPQMECNKRHTQFLHILNRMAKYGWVGPAGSFVDPQLWEDAGSKPGVILEYRIGPNQQPPQEIRPPSLPMSLIQMEQMGVADLRDVTGINVEMMALSAKEQAGVTVAHRIRQGLTILQNFFDNARRSAKIFGRILLSMIQQYYNDGRILMINGKEGRQMIAMTPDVVVGRYDVIVEENAWTPNRKAEVMGMLQQMLPVMLQVGLPIPPSVLDYLDLPADLVSDWKQMLVNFTPQPGAKGVASPPKAVVSEEI